jgi:phage I-like protein
MAEQKGAPLWVELIPAGEIIEGRDGRTWTNPNPDQIVDAFDANGADLPIDVEHATELKAPNGDPAPAVAWIKALEVRDGGAIWGLVEWVDHGRWMVDSKEYRYLSPVFLHKKDGEIVKLKSAGLTNNPNLHLTALNRRDNPDHEADPMNKALLALLGLAETATEQEAIAALTALNAQAKQVPGLETSLNAAKANAADLTKFVPRADHDTALNRASEAENTLKN